MLDRLCRRREAGSAAPFIIEDVRGEAVGHSAFYGIEPKQRHLSIGFTFLIPRVQRTAVNTETKLLMLTAAFEDRGMHRVAFHVDRRNRRACAAVERIGGRQDGILRGERLLPDGTYRDTVVFSILEDEWPEVKQRLHSRVQGRGAEPVTR